MELSELKHLEARQQPVWPDNEEVVRVTRELQDRAPLISSTEIDEVLEELSGVANGNALLLQAGDCAEKLDDLPTSVKSLLEIILPMTVTLMYSGHKVVKIARIAGQGAKPRSSELEVKNGVGLPSYRGDLVNGAEFTASARTPDPQRMLRFYDLAAKKLVDLKELANGDFANLEHVHEWNVEFADNRQDKEHYFTITAAVQKALKFMKAMGIEVEETRHARVYVSHEALLLPYELGLTRMDTSKVIYGSSAHMLWVGERTRQLEGAHIEYCANIKNPIGIKIGPTATADEVSALCNKLNPQRIPGRLTLIARMGAGVINTVLPSLLESVKADRHPVIWSSDPMHGNTINGPNDRKTREFDTIYEEYDSFITQCQRHDVWPGGIHLEATGDAVTECLGGSEPTTISDLEANYTTACDPRLNQSQSLELAFLIAERLSKV